MMMNRNQTLLVHNRGKAMAEWKRRLEWMLLVCLNGTTYSTRIHARFPPPQLQGGLGSRVICYLVHPFFM